MKKISLKRLLHLMSIIMLVGFVTVSCKKDKDDPDPDPEVVLDGIYLKGAATALVELNEKGMLKPTRNEVNQSDRASLLEIYVAVKAGSDGFNIVKVAGSNRTTYGPGADYAVVAEPIGDEPQVEFKRGSFAENQSKFTVDADGLYHVIMDTELNKIAVVPVSYWGLIGAATPGGWGGDTKMEPKGFDLNTITFEVENVTMTKADFKFRYSGGWKVVIDDQIDLGGGVVGVRVNTNYGGAVNALVPGGDDISLDAGGKYKATMVWKLGSPYAASLVKTGDLEVINYTDYEMGLVGDGLFVDGAQHNWDVTIQVQKPEVSNETNYTWNFTNVGVTTAGGGFKIRQGQDWNGKSIGYNDVVMAGLSAADFEANGDGNFVPKVDGAVYDIKFEINAVTEVYTFTVNPAGAAPEMFMLGDGCTAGWDNGGALPMVGTNGVYSITTTLLGAGKYIKFITTLGQWTPMYGTDGNGTGTSGNLVYRATESDPDPASIPAPETEGVYTITINTNDLTYHISAPLYMLGDGCAAGWDNGAALPFFTAGDGVYFLKTALGADKSIKFITTLGQWAPMYGTNAEGTSTGGALVFRATEGDPDPANIPTPAADGSYVVTANITNLTYTIAGAK